MSMRPPHYPKNAMPIGSRRLTGGAALVDAPLTKEDWRAVHLLYQAFITGVRQIAADAYARQATADPQPAPTTTEAP